MVSRIAVRHVRMPIDECGAANQLAFVHDELQYETHPKNAKKLMDDLELSAKLAGEYYNLRCPIAAEAKQGKTWADVH